MTKQNMLLEEVNYTQMEITESIGEGKQKRLRVRGEFGKADVPTRNGRIYPRSVYEKAIKQLGPMLKKRAVFGELDHPDDSKSRLERVSHIITDLHIDDDGRVIGEAEILPTPAGKIIQTLLESNVSLGVSSRGFGSVVNRGGRNYVGEDYVLKTFDFVAEPADVTAYPEVVKEEYEQAYKHALEESATCPALTPDYVRNEIPELWEALKQEFEESLNEFLDESDNAPVDASEPKIEGTVDKDVEQALESVEDDTEYFTGDDLEDTVDESCSKDDGDENNDEDNDENDDEDDDEDNNEDNEKPVKNLKDRIKRKLKRKVKVEENQQTSAGKGDTDRDNDHDVDFELVDPEVVEESLSDLNIDALTESASSDELLALRDKVAVLEESLAKERESRMALEEENKALATAIDTYKDDAVQWVVMAGLSAFERIEPASIKYTGDMESYLNKIYDFQNSVLMQLEQTIESLRESNTALQNELKESKSTASMYKKRAASLRADNESLIEDLEKTEARVKTYKERIVTLKEDLNEAREQLNEMNELQGELGVLRAKVDELEEQVIAYKDKLVFEEYKSQKLGAVIGGKLNKLLTEAATKSDIDRLIEEYGDRHSISNEVLIRERERAGRGYVDNSFAEQALHEDYTTYKGESDIEEIAFLERLGFGRRIK